MTNEQIKKMLNENSIYMWQVAKVLGIHDTTFSKWFREPLTKDQQMQVSSAVENIKLSRMKQSK